MQDLGKLRRKEFPSELFTMQRWQEKRIFQAIEGWESASQSLT